VNKATLPDNLQGDTTLLCSCVAGAAPVGKVEAWLTEAGFTAVSVTPKPESREMIATWSPGSGIEDYVVSAAIEAHKPA
jgi:hypothetical protein